MNVNMLVVWITVMVFQYVFEGNIMIKGIINDEWRYRVALEVVD